MTAEEILVARLGTSVGVTGLVATRIYPAQAPQGAALPVITYQRISTTRLQALRGSLQLTDPRIQLDCWAETYGGAKALAREVRQSLDGYQDPAGTFALLLDERDLLDAEGRRHRVSQDYSIWMEEG